MGIVRRSPNAPMRAGAVSRRPASTVEGLLEGAEEADDAVAERRADRFGDVAQERPENLGDGGVTVQGGVGHDVEQLAAEQLAAEAALAAEEREAAEQVAAEDVADEGEAPAVEGADTGEAAAEDAAEQVAAEQAEDAAEQVAAEEAVATQAAEQTSAEEIAAEQIATDGEREALDERYRSRPRREARRGRREPTEETPRAKEAAMASARREGLNTLELLRGGCTTGDAQKI